tara:strand:+ start:222 stop:455 length:234 start_codon:yes stop_codon:yes gene_type:complete
MNIREIMLNKRRRETNKSKGPWGMKSFNITYKKIKQKLERHRFVSAPSKKGALQQFEAIMAKADIKVEILSIREVEE